MTTIMMSIIAFLVAISVLIAFHEWGHFLVARVFGIHVLRFSIGFGKKLWSFTSKKGTEYRISLLPLGGYVKLLDETEGPVALEDRPYAFNYQSVWIRIAVVLAGPVFNLIFAIFAYWLMFVIGIHTVAPVLGAVAQNSIAEKAGFKSGDEILAVNHKKTPDWYYVNLALIRFIGEDEVIQFTVQPQYSKELQTYLLNLKGHRIDVEDPNLLKDIGFSPFIPSMPPIVAKVVPNSPASLAGLKAGDKIISVGKIPIKDWQELSKVIQKDSGQKTVFTLMRNNKKIQLPIILKHPLGIQSEPIEIPKAMERHIKFNPLTAMVEALEKTGSMITLTLILLYKLITGTLGLGSISGPIGIAQGAAHSLQLGFSYYLAFVAIISISLGIINLLPIPILDGGHLLYYFIELIRGRPLSPQAQETGLKIGLLVLLFIMAFAIINDLSRLL